MKSRTFGAVFIRRSEDNHDSVRAVNVRARPIGQEWGVDESKETLTTSDEEAVIMLDLLTTFLSHPVH